jgi:hypothetical protein
MGPFSIEDRVLFCMKIQGSQGTSNPSRLYPENKPLNATIKRSCARPEWSTGADSASSILYSQCCGTEQIL